VMVAFGGDGRAPRDGDPSLKADLLNALTIEHKP
jgi:hypothetical protein